MSENKSVNPKQYTHIDYEALLIYVMKNGMSVEQAIEEFDLGIARSTVIRNINKIKKQDEDNEINDNYKNDYVPNRQKEKLPDVVKFKIDLLPEKTVIVKTKLKDLYTKLTYMKEIVDRCSGNLTEATRQINSGNTILGNVAITRQALGKNMLRYEIVKAEYEKEQKAQSKLKQGREEK